MAANTPKLTKYRNKKSGKIYEHICIANGTATRHNWHVTMVYRDIETGEIWSRKLINFLAANEQIDGS